MANLAQPGLSTQISFKDVATRISQSMSKLFSHAKRGFSLLRSNLPDYIENVGEWLKKPFGGEPDVTVEAAKAGLNPTEYRAGLVGMPVGEYLASRAYSWAKLNPAFLFSDRNEFNQKVAESVNDSVMSSFAELSKEHNCSINRYVAVADNIIEKAMGKDYGVLGREVLSDWGIQEGGMEIDSVSLGGGWEQYPFDTDYLVKNIDVNVPGSNNTVQSQLRVHKDSLPEDFDIGGTLVVPGDVPLELSVPLSDVPECNRVRTSIVTALGLADAYSEKTNSFSLAEEEPNVVERDDYPHVDDGQMHIVISDPFKLSDGKTMVASTCTGRFDNGQYAMGLISIPEDSFSIEEDLGDSTYLINVPADTEVKVYDPLSADNVGDYKDMSAGDFYAYYVDAINGTDKINLKDYLKDVEQYSAEDYAKQQDIAEEVIRRGGTEDDVEMAVREQQEEEQRIEHDEVVAAEAEVSDVETESEDVDEAGGSDSGGSGTDDATDKSVVASAQDMLGMSGVSDTTTLLSAALAELALVKAVTDKSDSKEDAVQAQSENEISDDIDKVMFGSSVDEYFEKSIFADVEPLMNRSLVLSDDVSEPAVPFNLALAKDGRWQGNSFSTVELLAGLAGVPVADYVEDRYTELVKSHADSLPDGISVEGVARRMAWATMDKISDSHKGLNMSVDDALKDALEDKYGSMSKDGEPSWGLKRNYGTAFGLDRKEDLTIIGADISVDPRNLNNKRVEFKTDTGVDVELSVPRTMIDTSYDGAYAKIRAGADVYVKASMPGQDEVSRSMKAASFDNFIESQFGDKQKDGVASLNANSYTLDTLDKSSISRDPKDMSCRRFDIEVPGGDKLTLSVNQEYLSSLGGVLTVDKGAPVMVSHVDDKGNETVASMKIDDLNDFVNDNFSEAKSRDVEDVKVSSADVVRESETEVEVSAR